MAFCLTASTARRHPTAAANGSPAIILKYLSRKYEPLSQQLLKTKFHLPSARPDNVRRPRLTDLIGRGLEGPLTLISAPAGAGKSTLVGEWRQSDAGRSRQFAWLSLDDADSDPVRFFTYFAAALDNICPGIGDAAASLFRSSDMGDQWSENVIALINEISDIEDDFVLGLDDYHAITDERVHERQVLAEAKASFENRKELNLN